MRIFRAPDLLKDSPTWVLFALATPMIFGIAANMSFNLVDSYFIGQLGVEKLAAIGFSFPVVMLLLNLAVGYGIGVSSVLSRLIGQGDEEAADRLGTVVFLAAIAFGILVAGLGHLTISPFFKFLGASDRLIPDIREYMQWAYWAMAFRMMSMALTAVFRARGNTLIPSLTILITAGLNLVIDPVLIFGLFGFPELGITGAGLATLVANFIALAVEAYLAFFTYQIVAIRGMRELSTEVTGRIRNVFKIAGPAALGNALNPIANNLGNWILASLGAAAVAGFGVAIKLQAFAFVPVLAMSAAVGPFVGQNYGSGQKQRVVQMLLRANILSILWILMISGPLIYFRKELASLFTNDPQAIAVTAHYIVIVLLSLIGYASVVFGASAANAVGRPFIGMFYISLRTVLFLAPLAFSLFAIFGASGFFIAIALSNVAAGIFSFIHSHKRLLEIGEAKA